MTKQKSTKRALLLSALSLLMCVSMLIGSTFAWFTDSVTSSGNIIKSGTLDVEMYWAEGKDAVPTTDAGWTDASQGAIFNYDKWEPGYAVVRHIKIANEGTLALKYKLAIVANGEVSDLADVIDVYYVDPAVQVSDRAQLTDANKLGTLTEVLANLANTANGELLAGENDTITLALKMQETAGNEYQNKSIGTSFSVQLLATQLTSEFDSFDELYDQNAGYAVEVSTAAALADALRGGGLVKLTGDITVDEAIEIPAGVTATIDLNGNTLTGSEYTSSSGTTSLNNVFVNNGELTITGSGEIRTRNIINNPGAKLVIDGNIKIIGGNPAGGGSAIWNEGDCVIKNVTIEQVNTGNYAIQNVADNSTMVIENAKVVSKHGAISNLGVNASLVVNGGYYEVTGASTDHIIYAPAGTVTINGGSYNLSQANASSLGSTIIDVDGAVTINGGTFDSVSGAFAYNADSVLVINGGKFLNKAATVYGGNFAQFVADGYKVTETNGAYVVSLDKENVSTADTLAAALAEGGNVKLTGNITVDTSLEIPAGVEVTLDLNGKEIKGTVGRDANNNRIHTLVNNGTLTIKNGTVASAGDNGGSAIYNAAGAVLTIEDTTIEGAPFAGTAWPSYGINNYGTMTVNSAIIKTYHGGIATNGDGVTVINYATVDVGQNTETNQTSWALYTSENGKLTVNDGVFENTKNEYNQVYGGGYLCPTSTGEVVINGGTFNKTEADNNGSGIYYNPTNLVITGGTFDTNPSAYVADGYAATDNGDGTWTVTAQ